MTMHGRALVSTSVFSFLSLSRCGRLWFSTYSPDLSKKPFFGGLVDYFASGPIVAMVWEGPEVILTGRKMLGATNPNSSEPGKEAACVPWGQPWGKGAPCLRRYHVCF